MAGPMMAPPPAAAGSGVAGGRKAGVALALVYVTTLFFIWAFVTNLIDPLVKSMKVIYTLSDFETQLNQFAFFIAYGLVSLPAALLVRRLRAVRGIIVALAEELGS